MTDALSGQRSHEDHPGLSGAGLAGLAHDLKSWITPARACLQLWENGELEKAGALRASALQNLDAILACLESLRQRAPIPDPKMETVRLGVLARRAMNLCEAHFQEKNLQVDFQTVSHDALSGDEVLLLRLVTNLLSNAAQAAPAGSRVALAIATASATPDSLSVSVQNHVSPPAEPSGETSPRSGLGLRICREIAQLHKGHLDLQCGPDPGLMTVVVTLPRA